MRNSHAARRETSANSQHKTDTHWTAFVTDPTETLNYCLDRQVEQGEVRLKIVGLKVTEWVLAVCGLALAAVVCFLLAALGAYATSVDLPPYLQVTLIVFSRSPPSGSRSLSVPKPP